MLNDRFVKVMLVVIVLLLAANLVKENISIRPAFAATSSEPPPGTPASLASSGSTVWVLVGSYLFYAKVDQYNRIEVFGPEKLKY
ncbi:MAG: hypothetical protein EXS64_12515 [Candidatus Latescibacteria bacterium]|nr:hypothetical protein [Candidatus Latescibacterota bacterium]